MAGWLIVSLAAAYGNWLLYGMIAVFALGRHKPQWLYLPAEAPRIIGCFTASVLGAAVVLFVPQGIVVREGVFVFLLSTLLSVPVPEAVAGCCPDPPVGHPGRWSMGRCGPALVNKSYSGPDHGTFHISGPSYNRNAIA